ncbi:hypothetical protein F443_21038 [Phytophthora nicotianae P1569]|uniref:BZIP domain-containing protein n=1 Tax=Phytophthora nicotianae P1569 TaxID=1317065 RepID=V9E0P3_PHYNI|nr:hypothetical protein F443_21038 [Phytophthora nicotianae P1569]
MASMSPAGFMPILQREAPYQDLDTLAAFVLPLIQPLHAPPVATQQRHRLKGKSKGRPTTSSERGIKFRHRQQEKQIALLSNNQMLRQQVLRLQDLRDMRTQQSLSTPYSSAGSSPMNFVMEYFNQFRIGLSVPGAPANVLSSDKQRSFLNAMIEPHTTLGGKPAANRILSVWESYSNFHSSVKLSCDSTELITADNCSSVVVHGTLHLRYSRRTIENVYPHAVAEEDLIQMLIGRQLHVHYRAEMHFNSKGRLESYAMSPDFVGALMEILRSWRDCERILGRALIKGHVLGEEPEPEVDMEPVEIVSDAEIKYDVQETSSPSILHQIEETEEPARTTSRAMKLDYILS